VGSCSIGTVGVTLMNISGSAHGVGWLRSLVCLVVLVVVGGLLIMMSGRRGWRGGGS